ncbi:MAG: hypothetical protein WC554_16520 [Clostridia bacterium]
MFNQQSDNFKYFHIAKGIYLTSNNVVIDFKKIGAMKYFYITHKDNLPIGCFDSPCKSQEKILALLEPFLSSFNFNLDFNIIRNEVNDDLNLLRKISEHKNRIEENYKL